jgi:4-amino-4-deoxy-L-arabinose transferase-like glycosyltransferase
MKSIRWDWWRSPDDQPRWARPALLGLTLAAGIVYGWNAAGNLEIFYAAADRSMAMSWHNFFFAAFDPAGTVTVDKLPGALWPQAAAVRLFGVHPWVIVLPQALEGMAAVLVLYHAVRRLAGPIAAILAAGVLVVSPATVALDRGNIPDTLMVLLVLLAADATITATITGRLRSLVAAAVWVGLAFQAKMIEAWLVLPALALVYILAGPAAWARRGLQLAAAAVVAAAVSLSWMVLVSRWPASQRPYVDGSTGNSIFSQVFVYNGFGRLDQPSPNQLLTKAIGLTLGSAPPAWNRLLTGAYGRDTAWLIPASLIALVGTLYTRRHAGRTDLLRAGSVLWGTWLIVLLVAFSASSSINPYYTAALSPPIAGLLGTGAAVAWRGRTTVAARVTVAATVTVTCGYAAWLIPPVGVGLVAGLSVAAVVIGLAAVGSLLASVSRAGREAPGLRTEAPAAPGSGSVGAARAAVGGDRGRLVAFVLAGVAILFVPAVASLSVVAKDFGPFDTPFESVAASSAARDLGASAKQVIPLLPALEQRLPGQTDLMATQTSAVAAPFIYETGQEVLPIGGYSGSIPEPSLTALRVAIARGEVHVVVQAPKVEDPRLVWVAGHCLTVDNGQKAATASGLRFAVYFCGRL